MRAGAGRRSRSAPSRSGSRRCRSSAAVFADTVVALAGLYAIVAVGLNLLFGYAGRSRSATTVHGNGRLRLGS